MANQSKIEIALEKIKTLRSRHRQAYFSDLEKANNEGLTKSLDVSMTFNRHADLICKKIIYILEDIETKANDANQRDR